MPILQLAQFLAVQFCPNHKIDETLKKRLENLNSFFSESVGSGRWEQIAGGGDPALEIQDPEVNALVIQDPGSKIQDPEVNQLWIRIPKILAP